MKVFRFVIQRAQSRRMNNNDLLEPIRWNDYTAELT